MPLISGSCHSSKNIRGRLGKDAAASACLASPAPSRVASASASSASPTSAPVRRTAWRISATLRWLKRWTGTPRLHSSRPMSAWRSEKPRTRSGRSSRMRSKFASRNELTRGLRRASGGRTTNPETPTTRSPTPSRYSVSTVSSVRHTTRWGQGGAAGRSASSVTAERLPSNRPEVHDRGSTLSGPGVRGPSRSSGGDLGGLVGLCVGLLLRGRGTLDQPLAPAFDGGRDADQLRNRADRDLAEDRRPVCLHRPLGDAQLGTDLLVELPVDEPLEDRLLPGGESLQSLPELEQPRVVQPLGFGSRERLLHRASQLLHVEGLAQHVHHPGLDRAHHDGQGKRTGDEDDRCPLGGLLEKLVEWRTRTIDAPEQALARARGALVQRGEPLDTKTDQLQQLLKRLPLALVAIDQLYRPRSQSGWSHPPLRT